MKSLPILLAVVAAFAPTSSHAVVDMGGAPDISDLYELEFNNGALLPDDFDPTLDHDGDGISTLMEYRCFWSDPFDANDRGPRLQLAPFGGGAWQASWQTRKGLSYQLEFSPDLVTWLPAGSQVVGTGAVVARGLDPGVARIFYRLSCPDASLIDADGDGVCAVEEGIAGTWDNMEMSDPASGVNDIFKAVAIVLAVVAPQAGQDPPVEVGTVVTGLPHTQITEIPQGVALIKGGYFSMPPITDSENWDRFPGAGRWKPLSGTNLELQKGDGEQQPWYGQWCELDAHWQNPDRSDHTGPIAHGIEQTIPSVPCGQQLFLFFDCCRRYEGADTVTITARSGDPARTMTVLSHTAPGGWERIMVPLKIPKPAPNIISLPLCLRFNIGDGLDSYGIFVDNIELIAVDIVPDDGMVGVVGDVVPSAKPGSTVKHFVTPKKSAEIAHDFVLLKATGLNAVCFGERFAWDGGEAGASAEKQKVSRTATGMTPVKIKTQQAAVTAAQMDVWVVWSEIETVNDGVAGKGFFTQEVDPVEGPFARWWVVPNPANGRRFTCTIVPASIITADERPSLDGPGSKVAPGDQKQFVIDNRKADEAENKWDMSRRFLIKVKNPGGILKSQLGDPVALFVNQPTNSGDAIVVEDVPVQLPQDPAEGNDDPPPVDPLWKDEDTNPYQARNEAGQQAHLNHQIGEMASFDAPQHIALNSWGVGGRKYGLVFDYQEFARVELWDKKRQNGKFWFRISDHFNWHHAMEVEFSGNTLKWEDNGSSAAVGHK